MTPWLEGRVAARRAWTDTLYSLEVEAPALTFVAGQFARLALPAPPGEKDPMVGRPYSFVNPPGAPHHEFYFNVVPGGPLSPRLAALNAGEPVWLGPRANGFFSIPEVPQAEALWCLSTGTGIGPFLSILRTAEPWVKFGRVVLVHAVRHATALNYAGVIAGVAREHAGAFSFVPVVSREAHPGALPGRIPGLIADGRLEARAGVPLTADNAHAMLCGNPAMVDDVQVALAARGMRRHRRKEPGHITLETYW
jgi:ferredoxin/flavodoxin---NADP+ reductase